ncbi:MAG TPA: hypothetical protein VF711_00855 [Acidimicrobiales bacterium]
MTFAVSLGRHRLRGGPLWQDPKTVVIKPLRALMNGLYYLCDFGEWPMASNPVSLIVPSNAKVIINSVSNASWYQRVTLTWAGGTAVFQGTGEGTPMLTPDGKQAVELSPSPGGYQISAFFEFSRGGGPSGRFSPARVQNPIITNNPPFTIIQTTSEDGGDNDNNDTYLTVVAVSSSSEAMLEAAQAESEHQKLGDGQQLSLHAKTYYDNPLVQGGDEHYFIIPAFSGQFGQVSYQEGHVWSARNGSVYNQDTPFGGYLYISIQLYNCQHPDMHNRTLSLVTTISYWGSKPTGYVGTDWSWEVGGTGKYTVTSVTR